MNNLSNVSHGLTWPDTVFLCVITICVFCLFIAIVIKD